MARQRMHKPERLTEPRFAECSPPARYLYTMLECFCDDYGVTPASIRTIKLQIYPSDDITIQEIEALIGELVTNKLIEHFEAENAKFIKYLDWDISHSPFCQKIDKRSLTRYPPYKHSTTTSRTLDDYSASAQRIIVEQSSSTPGVLDEHSRPIERKGMEENINLKKKTKAKKESLPEGHWEEFWKLYPHHDEQDESKKLFFEKVVDEETFSQVMTALRAQVAERAVAKQLGVFRPELPHAAHRWLRKRKWGDEVWTEDKIRSMIPPVVAKGPPNNFSSSPSHRAFKPSPTIEQARTAWSVLIGQIFKKSPHDNWTYEVIKQKCDDARTAHILTNYRKKLLGEIEKFPDSPQTKEIFIDLYQTVEIETK